MTSTREGTGQGGLLSYRLPREPSTPRIAVWRKLRRLGVAQISDGLVALPAGALDARGTVAIWLARPATRAQEDQLARAMAAARAAEYQALITAAERAAASPGTDPPARFAAIRRLRNEFRAIQRRDYFPPAEHDQAQAAVQRLAASPEAQAARPPGRASQPARTARTPARTARTPARTVRTPARPAGTPSGGREETP